MDVLILKLHPSAGLPEAPHTVDEHPHTTLTVMLHAVPHAETNTIKSLGQSCPSVVSLLCCLFFR